MSDKGSLGAVLIGPGWRPWEVRPWEVRVKCEIHTGTEEGKKYI